MRTAIEPRAIFAIVVAIAFGGVSSRVLSASQPTTSNDVLAALLVEVKGLRAAIEQMSSASGRIQLSVARLQIEEQRLNEAGKRLQDVRERLNGGRRELQDTELRIADYEKSLAGNPAEEARRTMDLELPILKRAAASTRAAVSQLSSEEAQLAQDIASEQARWIELSRRLDDLDASMAVRK